MRRGADRARWTAPGLLLLLLASPSFTADEAVGPVLDTLALAEQRHAQALQRDHGWSVTAPLMEAARSALVDGDLAAARSLAARALLTAEKALEQAELEEAAWRSRVVDE